MSVELWYLSVDGKQEGPFPVAVIVDRIATRRVSQSTYVYNAAQSGGSWVPITSAPVFHAALLHAALPPTAANAPSQRGLIRCNACGNENAKDAKACPRCGANLIRQRATAGGTLLKATIFAVLLIVGVGICVPDSEDPTARSASAAMPAVGPAPTGDPTAVATKIIKYNHPECRSVSGATRRPDGSIRAKCGGVDYLVFTVFNTKGETSEVALNCSAAKSRLNISC